MAGFVRRRKNGCNVFQTGAKKNNFGVRVLYFKDPFLWLVDFVIF